MRINTVALVNGHPSALACKQAVPRPGTSVRTIFDKLLSHPAKPIRLTAVTAEIRQLQDNYGLDIARRSDGRYVLRGRWLGTDYLNCRSGKIVAQRDL